MARALGAAQYPLRGACAECGRLAACFVLDDDGGRCGCCLRIGFLRRGEVHLPYDRPSDDAMEALLLIHGSPGVVGLLFAPVP